MIYIFKLTLSTGDPLDANPPDREHGGVVVDVEERDLVVLLAQNEEKGVHEFEHLGEVEPPQRFGYLWKQEGEGGLKSEKNEHMNKYILLL